MPPVRTARIREQAAAPPPAAMARWLARWDPVLSGLDAAARGDTGAEVREYLAGYRDSGDWASLAAALCRILDGSRDYDQLTIGLDQIDTAIIARALQVLDDDADIPAGLCPAMRLGPLLGYIAAAASGDLTAATRARQNLTTLGESPEFASLAAALSRR